MVVAIVTIMNSTFNHQKASDGAPVIINKSEAYFTGVNTLNLGEKSWYGINVDGDEDHDTLVLVMEQLYAIQLTAILLNQ